jgi:hypothetical protein
MPPWNAIQIANQLLEEVVGEHLRDDQLQECARPAKVRRAGREQPHGARALFVPPPFGIELLFDPSGVFQVTVDVDDDVTDLAHGQASTNPARRQSSSVPIRCGGPGPTAIYGV